MRAGDATVYKGRSGQWAFVAHRTTGFLVFMFLLLHIVDVSLVNANVSSTTRSTPSTATSCCGSSSAACCWPCCSTRSTACAS